MKNFKKYLLYLLGLVVLLTWIIKSGSFNGSFIENGYNSLGLFDILKLPFYTLQSYLDYGILVISIGIFYGVISKIDAYSKLVDNIVKKIKNKKLFLISLITILFLFSSLIGSSISIFIIVPFIYTILVLLGYSKITSFIALIGSLLAGNICSITSLTSFYNNSLFGLSIKNELLVKIIFLLMVLFLLINFIVNKSKNDKLKEKEVDFYIKKSSKKNVVPFLILFIVTSLLVILGTSGIGDIFSINLFKNIVVSINEVPFINRLLGSLEIFGSFSTYLVSILLVLMSLIISWVYSLGKEDIKDGITIGIKKTYIPALYVIMCNIISTCVISNNTFIQTVNNYLLGNGNFSVFKTSLSTIFTSLFYNNYGEFINSGLGSMLLLCDTIYYPLITFILTTVYYTLTFILPTNILLVLGLSYFDIDFKEWIKNIYKYLILIFILIIIIGIIMLLFI